MHVILRTLHVRVHFALIALRYTYFRSLSVAALLGLISFSSLVFRQSYATATVCPLLLNIYHRDLVGHC